MGNRSSRKCSGFDKNSPVDFSHFDILRSIGKGSYGKVCIAKKRDTEILYAMKYVNKMKCIEDKAVNNTVRELSLLRDIEHPYIVNLRYAFHDIEDMCLVVDLQLGGDLRFHLNKDSYWEGFSEKDIGIYMLELSAALDYLHNSHFIVHRDVKPDNILLGETGHLKLTDFNVATKLESGRLSTSEAGTLQYMAPEIFRTGIGLIEGYSFSVDWWSAGVTFYELLHGQRPYRLPKSPHHAVEMLESGEEPRYSSTLSSNLKSVLQELLSVDATKRISSLCEIESQLRYITLEQIQSGDVTPHLVPSNKKLNIDPCHELEEMIIESKPIHKKQARLTKLNPTSFSANLNPVCDDMMREIEDKFLFFDHTKRIDVCPRHRELVKSHSTHSQSAHGGTSPSFASSHQQCSSNSIEN